ncbi:MAG: hypothetical protein K6F22_08645 [Prevotella sp.]|nr:hypothetical protein [Prevotella sp.]
MNSFNICRFSKTFHWYLSVIFYPWLMWTIGYALVTFFGEWLFWYFHKGQSSEYVIDSIAGFFAVFIVIGLAIGVSQIFSDINKNARREAFLMLPASNIEKYLSAVIFVTVIWTFCTFLSFAVGDTARMIFRSLTYGEEWVSGIPELLDHMTPRFNDTSSFSYNMMERTLLAVIILWVHSAYVLGGTLLRKYSFVLTSMVIILVVALFGRVLMYFEISIFQTKWEDNVCIDASVGAMAYVLVVVLPLLACFNYWASYHIFKGFQLITNKWTNYDFFKR